MPNCEKAPKLEMDKSDVPKPTPHTHMHTHTHTHTHTAIFRKLEILPSAFCYCVQCVGFCVVIFVTVWIFFSSVYLNDNAFVEAILYEKKNRYFSFFLISKERIFCDEI